MTWRYEMNRWWIWIFIDSSGYHIVRSDGLEDRIACNVEVLFNLRKHRKNTRSRSCNTRVSHHTLLMKARSLCSCFLFLHHRAKQSVGTHGQFYQFFKPQLWQAVEVCLSQQSLDPISSSLVSCGCFSGWFCFLTRWCPESSIWRWT